mmetsp:Transcript_58812/g.140216  ORF Transcript_58812/g.140216 Transcript_58812/m.140216 type:complete len:789 (+) Transcript_58812:72-2438(+)
MPGQLYENLRQLITVVDELRDSGIANYISLPRIAACGTQSSGKSSLIESVVGLDFLPRGGGVVTRRPLELRLVHLNSMEHAESTAWAVFDKNPTKFSNFDDVRKEIERLTDEVAGSNKGIVDDPIILTIYAVGAPDLTLIDLPGITRVPVKGSDQAADIEKLTRDMTLRYIKDERTIIMAVLPANQDVSVSDALQLARQVDPKGLRTIGVITKIDIMDSGTDACRMLRGDDISLRLGYIGVKMRSQADIEAKKSVKLALEDEKEWFANHRLYSRLPPGMVGTNYLIDQLTSVLFKHIRRFLPEIKREINERRRDAEARLEELGGEIPVEKTERTDLVWTMITDFTDMFKMDIRGRYVRRLQKYMRSGSTSVTVSTGYQIRGIFNDFMEDAFQSGLKEMSDEHIAQAIETHEGDSLPGFPSPDTFEYLIIPELKKLMTPALEVVHHAAQCLESLSSRISASVLGRFPKMQEAVHGLAASIIAREKDSTLSIVEQTMLSETSYLFTNDVNYLVANGRMLLANQEADERAEGGLASSLRQGMTAARGAFSAGPKQSSALSRCAPGVVPEIRRRLESYYGLVVRNTRDTVPKVIGHFLVRRVEERLQFELYSALSSDEAVSEMLGEPPHIEEERRKLMEQLKVLQRASGVLTREPALASIVFEAAEDEEDSAPQRPAPTKKQVPVSSMPSAPSASSAPKPAPPSSSGPAAGASSAGGGGGGLFGGSGGGLFGSGGSSDLFDTAKDKASAGYEQVKQKVAQGTVNHVVNNATGGAVKEVPAGILGPLSRNTGF